MPVLTFEGGTIPEEKKKELIARLTEAAAGVTGIPQEKFIVLLRELDTENIGVGGLTLTEVLAARGAK